VRDLLVLPGPGRRGPWAVQALQGQRGAGALREDHVLFSEGPHDYDGGRRLQSEDRCGRSEP